MFAVPDASASRPIVTTNLDLLARAVDAHRAGDLTTAEAIYRQLLQSDPQLSDAWHLLGVLMHQQGRTSEALGMIEHALTLRPTDAVFLCNLGSIELSRRNVPRALECLHASLTLDAQQAKTWYNYGNALRAADRPIEALDAYRRAIALHPNYAEATTNLGVTLRDLGEHIEAAEAYRLVTQLTPQLDTAWFNYGNALAGATSVWRSLGDSRVEQGFRAAQQAYQQALQLNPLNAHVWSNLGTLFKDAGQLDAAVDAYHHAIAARSDLAEAHSNLAIVYQDQGDLEQAQAALHQALDRKPDFPEVHSNLCYLLNYDPQRSPAEVSAAHFAWARAQVKSPPRSVSFSNPREPNRPLRVGYVSPDLRLHPVGRFIEPALAHHDRSQYQIFVYADIRVVDQQTQRLQRHDLHWRQTHGLRDAQLVDLIRDDAIDILVDLAGHTAMNRLLIFAERCAPVQISYLGYPNTTGLGEMDYLITDSIVDPPGADELFSEQLLRVDPSFCCFQPPPDGPEVNELPALKRGPITFGSLHNLAKLNARVLDAWAELLRRLPDARLLVCRGPLTGTTRERFAAEFARRGIAAERVELRSIHTAGNQHWLAYHGIDISLDVFPWSGHTTACESLWMGVPVVSLRGASHAGRMVTSVLNAVGQTAWIAEDIEHYLAIACELAADREQLAQTRRTLRQLMASSLLCDATAFTRQLEAGLRRAWRAHGCGINSLPPPSSAS